MRLNYSNSASTVDKRSMEKILDTNQESKMDFFKVIRHEDLTYEQMQDVIQLKEEHWKYGTESQLKWIQNNICENDVHILGYIDSEDNPISYLNLVHLNVIIDGKKISYLGMGNVCVSKKYEHKGHARALILFSNDYIREHGGKGITLCRNGKEKIYSKYSWINLKKSFVTVGGKPFGDTVMLLDDTLDKNTDNIIISKNF